MVEEMKKNEINKGEKLFLPALFSSRFTTAPPRTLISLLLIEIGITFGLQVGIVGQISAVNSLVMLIASFIVSLLSVKYNHTKLLTIGLILQALSAITCSFSTSFYTLIFFFSLNGIGAALITPMTLSITAENLQGQKRANAIGWLIISTSAANIIGNLAINHLAGLSDWRLPFLAFLLPINLLSLVLVSTGIPKKIDDYKDSGKTRILEGYKKIYGSRSSIACLIGTIFSSSSIGGFLVYQASFFRQRHLISVDLAALMLVGNAICVALGSRTAGRLMKRFESRLLWTIAMIFSGFSILSSFTIPNLWAAMVLAWLVNFFMGIAFMSANSLTLDQIPGFRGTIMSLFTAANSMGSTIGASLGGFILLRYNYGFLGVLLGLITLLAALTVYLWAHSPTSSTHP